MEFRKIDEPWSVTKDEPPVPEPKMPETYEEAVQYVAACMDPESFKSPFCGMGIRNGLGLWHKESPLSKHMLERFGFCFADDTGMLISNAAEALVNGKPYTPDEDVKIIKEHWAKAGIDPRTMEKIK